MSHPLDKFQYCPVCGSKAFNVHNFKSKQCEDCGFTYYANPCSATAAFIRNERGELLVARRGKEPAKGTLDLPGGFVDMDETVEDGMRREIQEETGLNVNEVRYLFSIPNHYLYSDMLIYTIDMFYEVHVGNDVNPIADDDAAALEWLPLEQVNPKDFGLQSISQGVARYLSESLRK
jgi:NADH pyrophosphatase NudC (nudix superfamily)